MNSSTLEFLCNLVKAPSPSGYEQPAMAVVRERMKKIADHVATDVHGNVICSINPGARLRIMLAGHCDQIGFMVKHISDEGYIYFASIGGIDPGIVPGTRIRIHAEKGIIPGVIGRKPIHLMESDDTKKTTEIKKLWIDIGARDGKEAKTLVAIGDPVTFDADMLLLKNNLAAAGGFDDKAGVFVVCETLRLLKSHKKKPEVAVYGVATVQEELGLRGAITSTFGIDPHVGIAVDVTAASDYPSIEKTEVGDISLGKGPVIVRGANINPVLFDRIVGSARKSKISYQVAGAPRATGTDANVIQISRSGVAAGLVSIPNRYMHTPVEMVSLDDLENAAKLLAALIMDMSNDIDFTP